MTDSAGSGAVREVKLFISSPNDVMAERHRLLAVIGRVNVRFAGAVHIRPINYLDQLYRAHDTPQAQIEPAASCDIVISIFWTRLGRELPAQFPKRLPDGRPYPSGSAYEVLTAIEAARQHSLPDLYVFRKTAEGRLPTTDVQAREAFIGQLHALDAFWHEWFETLDGHFIVAFTGFLTTDEFEERAEKLLLQWLERKDLLGGRVRWPIHLRGSPYRDLDPFDAEHAEVFFGRSHEIGRGVERLTEAAARSVPFLFVVGASGTGKSSLAQAGLIPRLTAPGTVEGIDFWRVTIMKAGFGAADPLEELASCLLAGGLRELAEGPNATPQGLARQMAVDGENAAGLVRWALERASSRAHAAEGYDRPVVMRLLLLIDQFEGLFGPTVTTDARVAFARAVDALVRSGVVWIIATLRSTDYAHLQSDGVWLKLKEDGAALDLGPPDEVIVAEAIRGPAEAAGITFERDPQIGASLDEMLRADTARADVLPLLQFTLQRLFEERKDRMLTFAAYRELGGLEGAIAVSAERAVGALPNEAQAELPWLLRHLVGVTATGGVGGSDAVFALREMMLDDAALAGRLSALALIEALANARVLVLDGGREGGPRRVRLAHEAVLRSWQRARDAVDANARYFRSFAEMQASTAAWLASGKSRDRLLRGTPLSQAEDLVRDYGAELPAEMIDFVRVSRGAADRGKRITQAVAAAMVVLFLGASAAGVYAFLSERRTAAERNAALVAQSRYLAGIVRELSDAGDKVTALALALEVLPARVDSPDRPFEPMAEGALLEATRNVRERGVFRGHEARVRKLVLSPDGSRLLSLSDDGEARLWDLEKGWSVTTLRGARMSDAVFYSPHGAKVVVAADDFTARIRDVGTGAELAVLRGHTAALSSVTFSADGTRVLTVSTDKTARVWDAQNGTQLAKLEGQGDHVLQAVFSPDAQLVAIASSDMTLKIWEVQGEKQLKSMSNISADAVFAFSPDNARLVETYGTGGLVVYDTQTWSNLIEYLPGTNNRRILSVTFSANGSHMLVAYSDGDVTVYDEKYKIAARLRGHTGPVLSAVFSRDARYVLTAGADRTVRLWEVWGSKSLAVLAGHSDAVSTAVLAGDWVVSASMDKTVRLWFAGKATETVELGRVFGKARHVEYSPDGTLIVITGDHGYGVVSKSDEPKKQAELKHSGAINTARFSPDGRLIVTSSADRSARIWEAATGTEFGPLLGHQDEVSDAAFSPDGKLVVTASKDHSVRLWEVATRVEIGRIGEFEGQVTSASFSPDGSRILVSSADGRSRLWDANSKVLIRILDGHEKAVTSAHFSADGRRIVTASLDGTARVWDAENGQVVSVLRGHTDAVLGAIFSVDGSSVVTVSADSTARLWDAASGNLMTVFSGHEGPVTSANFSPDGTRLATSSADGSVRIWRIRRGQQLLDYACSLLMRPLTYEQRRQYFLEREPQAPRCGLKPWDN